jgi:hypothetical protein
MSLLLCGGWANSMPVNSFKADATHDFSACRLPAQPLQCFTQLSSKNAPLPPRIAARFG